MFVRIHRYIQTITHTQAHKYDDGLRSNITHLMQLKPDFIKTLPNGCMRHRQCINIKKKKKRKARCNEKWTSNGVAIMFAHLFSIRFALLITICRC